MNRVFDIRGCVPKSIYGLDIRINDDTLACLDTVDLYNSISSVRNLKSKPVHVKLTVDREHSFLEYSSFFKKIEESTRGNVKIDIYTSGSNFNSIMECIGLRNSGIECAVYIDDQDVREILDICEIDFSKAVCPCYLSRRYVRNLNDEEFRRIYNSSMFEFNREKALAERRIIRDVWKEISPVSGAIDKLSPLSKMVLVADYINSHISYAHDGHYISGRDSSGRNVHHVEDWAKNGVSTYERKKGVCSGQSDLASILLDNYLAKTNCRRVEGFYAPFNDSHEWIVLTNQGKNYGVCLTMSKRFVDLSKVGYLEGEVSLESNHSDRTDYTINIDSYVDVPRDNYTNFRTKVYDVLHSHQSINGGDNNVPPALPPRRKTEKVVPPPLPPRREIEEMLPPPLPPRKSNGYQYQKKGCI